jgi:DNA-binding CsgD family transcriptional regulator
MASKTGMAVNLTRHTGPGETSGETRDLLNALFKSSTVGVGIFDRQLRYQAINDALASMNGVPAEAHLGRTIHAVLGRAAAKIQPAFEHVFATGRPLSNFEVTAELPSRDAIGHWNESYFPIKDHSGQVQQVGAVVLELTKRNEIEASLVGLMRNLTRMMSALRHDSGALDPSGIVCDCANPADFFARSAVLLESCMSETRAISQLLHSAPTLTAVQARRHCNRRVKQRTRDRSRDLAVAHPVQRELEFLSPLSSREQEVIALLATGRSNKEIGTKLVISTRTVESHRAKIMLKLDLHSLSELVRYAVRIHLIDP